MLMFEQAADIVRQAEVFIITAGAGMGVDSGLPDFRGDQGFWKAYPMYARLGLSFADAANPQHFEHDPAFGWGFYGHRTNLYRETVPHEGFHILQQWISRNAAEFFIITSNVDGQFQKAGFSDDRILEVHGSIHHLQCIKPCCHHIWPNHEEIDVDLASMRARSIPLCPYCNDISRPNILMFGDWSWLPERTNSQESAFQTFMERNSSSRIAVIEMGAGTAIPTIRVTSERIGRNHAKVAVIRINPREFQIQPPHISFPCGALEGLQQIDRYLGNMSGK